MRIFLAKTVTNPSKRTSTQCNGGPRTLRDGGLELGLRATDCGEHEVIKNVMLKETVDGEFTTVEDVAEVALFFAAFNSSALTGQSAIVSHGWFME